MAEVKPAEVSAILKQQLTGFQASASLDEVGTVLNVGDGEIGSVCPITAVSSNALKQELVPSYANTVLPTPAPLILA